MNSFSVYLACFNGGCFSLWNQLRLRMMILCSMNLFYYSLIGLALYHFIGKILSIFFRLISIVWILGPWYFGYLTEGYFGAVFLWGTVVRGIYLPPDMQTYMGTIQVIHNRDRQNCTALMLHLVECVLTPSRRSDGGARTRKKLACMQRA